MGYFHCVPPIRVANIDSNLSGRALPMEYR